MPAKWTLGRLLQRAVEIHGDRFDYSSVTEDHIKCAMSRIPLTCNTCRYEWEPSIGNHINKGSGCPGCPGCSGKAHWTLKRFLERVVKVHGNKFDYSKVTEDHIKGDKSRIPLTCNICSYEYSSTIDNHINHRTGCPDCSGKVKWTLERLLQRANEIHGNEFDYSKVTADHIKGVNSNFPLTCNTCSYEWNVSIVSHINGKRGCPDCSLRAPWILERFLQRAVEIHGDKFDYSKVTEDHIKSAKSKVPLTCNTCRYEWEPSINVHINGKYGCPDCSLKAPWTLERFLQRAVEIHGDKFDYSKVTEDHIKGVNSNFPFTCRICSYEGSTTIGSHINYRSGCPDCYGKAKWTLERLLQRANEIHGNEFDYSKVTEDHIKGVNSKFPLTCNTCHYEWNVSIGGHINGKSGCPVCRSSKGEKECQRVLEEYSLDFQREVILPELPRKRFDFAFAHENNLYLVEFDGIQHFEEIEFFDRTKSLQERQENDLVKTQVALQRGAILIRIDYMELDNIADHIYRAIEEGNKLYFSTPDMYHYIRDHL